MNTETLNALKSVREAKTLVLNKLTDKTISKDEKLILGDVLIGLEADEDILINDTLQDMVDKINVSNDALKKLIVQMDKVSKHISDISNAVKKVSNILAVFTEITGKALSAGLLG
jgi:hypothetical protein